MLEVLGCYSADYATQLAVNSNFIANELSLFSQKDRKPICFFMMMCCFLGGVSAINYKNIFRCCTVQPGSFSHESWKTLALCPVNGLRTPRCGRHITREFCRVCDSNVVSRGVYSKGIVASFIIPMGVLSQCRNIFYFVQIHFQLLMPVYFSSQLPADSRSSAIAIVFLLLKLMKTDVSCFICTKSFTKCESQKGALKIAECLKQSV